MTSLPTPNATVAPASSAILHAERITKRFAKVDKQVSDLAKLEIELRRERITSGAEMDVADVLLLPQLTHNVVFAIRKASHARRQLQTAPPAAPRSSSTTRRRAGPCRDGRRH